MKAKLTGALSFILFLTILSPFPAFAQIFGADEENWEKVFIGLKKINSRLVNLETEGLSRMKSQLENMLREIEEVKYALPQLQGMVEQNKSETLSGLNTTNAKLNDLQAEVKNQVLNKIRQQNNILKQFQSGQGNLQVGLAQDMEKFEQSNKNNFQEFYTANNETLGQVIKQLGVQSATTKKGFEDTISLFSTDVIPTIAEENQKNRQIIMDHLGKTNMHTQKNLNDFSAKNQKLNQKLIEILQESLKQGVETKFVLNFIKKNMADIKGSAAVTNQNISETQSVIAEIKKSMIVTNNNLKIADEKTNKLAESLQAQNTTSNVALGALKAEQEHAGEFNKLADEKFNKLIELTSKLAVHSTELESSVTGQLKDSAQKEDARTTKVELANEKLSRLIEILKTIVKEQAKLGNVAKTMNELKKEQATLQKNQKTIQLSLKNSQKEIKEALADLRRKANVNISRSDDIKKTLGRSSAGKK